VVSSGEAPFIANVESKKVCRERCRADISAAGKVPEPIYLSAVVFGEPERRERLIGPYQPALEVFSNDELL